MSRPSRQPKPPTVSLVNEYLRKWDTLEKYTLQEASLALLFRDLCPRNEDISQVLLKVSALNDFYSTNIYDTHSVAKHILALGVSDRILAGDTSLVDELALISINGKQKRFYSFASKYCSHHNAKSFPIYDSYVHKMLMHFYRVDRFEIFHKEDLKSYGRFVEIIHAFRRYYALEQFSLREIDIYLWLAGKDAFLRPPKGAQHVLDSQIKAQPISSAPLRAPSLPPDTDTHPPRHRRRHLLRPHRPSARLQADSDHAEGMAGNPTAVHTADE